MEYMEGAHIWVTSYKSFQLLFTQEGLGRPPKAFEASIHNVSALQEG